MSVISGGQAALIQGIKDYALAHYEEGWDVVYECYGDEEILETIGNARTLRGALACFATLTEVYQERYADALISAGDEHRLITTARATEATKPCSHRRVNDNAGRIGYSVTQANRDPLGVSVVKLLDTRGWVVATFNGPSARLAYGAALERVKYELSIAPFDSFITTTH